MDHESGRIRKDWNMDWVGLERLDYEADRISRGWNRIGLGEVGSGMMND